MDIDTTAAQLILLAGNYADFDPSRGLIFGHQKNYIGLRLKRGIPKHLHASKAALGHEYADGFFTSAGISKLGVDGFKRFMGGGILTRDMKPLIR